MTIGIRRLRKLGLSVVWWLIFSMGCVALLNSWIIIQPLTFQYSSCWCVFILMDYLGIGYRPLVWFYLGSSYPDVNGIGWVGVNSKILSPLAAEGFPKFLRFIKASNSIKEVPRLQGGRCAVLAGSENGPLAPLGRNDKKRYHPEHRRGIPKGQTPSQQLKKPSFPTPIGNPGGRCFSQWGIVDWIKILSKD